MEKRTSTPKTAQDALQGLYLEFGSWRKVAQNLDHASLNPGLLSRIAKGKKPAPNSVLFALGLPLKEVPAQPCKRCGDVHVTKRCTKRKEGVRVIDYQERDRKRLELYVRQYNG